MPGAMTLQCFAHLYQNVSDALPYLNTVLSGFEYINDPPSLTFQAQGKLITVYGRKIAITAIKNQTEAHKILNWIKREINYAWLNRDNIEPSYESLPKPRVIEILKLLPMTNCKECGAPTCMVFAVQVAEGAKDISNCTSIIKENKIKLIEYVNCFSSYLKNV
jgi:ArsR family metal-binding transcriptional regulator